MRRAVKITTAFVLFVFLLTGAILPGFAANLPSAPSDSFVYDEANVISADTEQLINKKSRALYALSGAQIAVVAVNNTGYSDLEEYACDLFNKWGVGDAKENNGVLFVMEISTYKYWVTVGYGLEGKITPGILQNIFDSGLELAVDTNRYDDAAKIFCNKITEYLENIYNIDTSAWDGVTYRFGNEKTISNPAGGKTESKNFFNPLLSKLKTFLFDITDALLIIAFLFHLFFSRQRHGSFSGSNDSDSDYSGGYSSGSHNSGGFGGGHSGGGGGGRH